MKNNSQLLEMLEDLYLLEKEAHDLYKEYIKELTNKDQLEIISKICSDEMHHMKIVRSMIETVKQNDNR